MNPPSEMTIMSLLRRFAKPLFLACASAPFIAPHLYAQSAPAAPAGRTLGTEFVLDQMRVALVAAPLADAPAAPAEPAFTPELRKIADDFFHYASIARYDLANAEADKLSAFKPAAVLAAF